jgi:hypothetical protein
MLKFNKNAQPIQRVNTGSKQTIDSSIFEGLLIRNGSNRLFKIESLTPKQVILTSINGEREQTLILSRPAFISLYYMKNYVQVIQEGRLIQEWIDSKEIGSNRFIIKPEKFQL